MSFRILAAIVRKDLLSLYPLALLTALLFAADVFILRWELVPMWPQFRPLLLAMVLALTTLAVFQLDAPVSVVDDWLCRPVPKAELVAAKLSFLFLVVYLPAALATWVADLCRGAPAAEALQDAVLLADRYLPLVVPILLLTGLVTRTLVQGIGTLIALFVCMFVLPTPFTRAPDPTSLAIGDFGLSGAGLDWLAMTPAKLVPVALTALAFWLVYWRRRILPARILLALTACLTVSNPWPDLRGPRWGGTRTPPGSLTEGLQEHFGDPSVRVFPDQTAGAGPTSTSRARSYREAGAPRTGDVFRH